MRDKHAEENRERFDAMAASWDEDPRRVETARAVAAAIVEAVPLTGEERALEFGSGTGLVTVLLAPHVAHVVAADGSPGMLEVLERKRRDLGLDNVETVQCDLSRELPKGNFGLIYSSMTLHHIDDVPALLARLAEHLEPGGWLAVADLDSESGKFHGDVKGVAHHGFSRADFENWLSAAGLTEIRLTTAHTVERETEEGVESFPLFLAAARKPL
ncbi:MAG TPA: class I SAM-dependent methyltransferase [Thermoanaerobaculia bacterium]|nr:class I SAM-dependent methyltransferase [Thermoanaerobaculia bacterium]